MLHFNTFLLRLGHNAQTVSTISILKLICLLFDFIALTDLCSSSSDYVLLVETKTAHIDHAIQLASGF